MASHRSPILWLVPTGLFLLFLPFSGGVDLAVTDAVYNEGFVYGNLPFFAWLYHYGEIPALLTAGTATLLFLLSFCVSSLNPWRKTLLMVLLTLVIGSGVITTGLLKGQWGRPRPRQVVEFGGDVPFRAVYQPNFGSSVHKSFCCGHCTMGYFFFALVIAGWRKKNRFLLAAGWTLALFLGISLSAARIAQGGHFFTDTLAAALVMWLTALALDWLIPEEA